MSLPEIIHPQLRSLPIPPAALVIDIRGVDDDVLDTLQIEIENLTNEMEMQKINHWRYLTEFLAFKRLEPISFEDVKMLRTQEEEHSKQQRSLSGRFHRGERKYTPGDFYVDEDVAPSFLENIPNDELKRNVEESIQLIDAIRNKRIEATGDVGKTGKIGPNTIDAKVQVIFLTNAEEPDTLSSASAYAAHLKLEYEKLEESGQLVLDTMIICLNHNNQAAAPTQLMNRLQWKNTSNEKYKNDAWWHIDSLILSERYGANAARIPEDMQPYIAELLLYTLLITQQPMVRPAIPNVTGRFLPPANAKIKESRSLPPKTYLVGLTAIEHSARWGRRLLNHGLATQTIQVLQDKQFDEKDKIRRTAETWLSDWRALVSSAIPYKVAGDIPVLHAFEHSKAVASPPSTVFVSNPLLLDVGKKTEPALKQYSENVAQTYTMSVAEREDIRKKIQETTPDEQEIFVPPTMEDALGSVPQIQRAMMTWQDGDLETPLIEAQVKAFHILSEPDFYTEPQGAIPRAKSQLAELSGAIRDFQNKHKQSAVNLQEKRKKLIEYRDKEIKAVQSYIQQFPLFAGLLRLKGVLAWLTLLFAEILCVIAAGIGFTWLHHLAFLAFPTLTAFLDNSLFGISFYTIIVCVVLLAAVVLLLLNIRRIIVNKKRSALRVEMYFWIALIAFPLLGLLVSLSAGLYDTDPKSAFYLSWFSRLPFYSSIIFAIALLILVIEVIYYFIWHGRLARSRVKTIEGIREHRKETEQAVIKHIADSLALELLQRAGLTDGASGYGSYYRRVELLTAKLEEIRRQSNKEYQLATRRLNARANSMGAAKTPTLRIREEILDVPALMLESKRLRESLTYKSEELKEFAEILLRVMGEEAPNSIEEQFRERPLTNQQFGERPFQEMSDQHDAQTLLSISTATALRMAISTPQVDTVTPLKKRYEGLDYQVRDQLSVLKSLLDMMQKKVSTAELIASSETHEDITRSGDVVDIALATHALSLWGQLLWEHKEPETEKLLTSNGVMSQLQHEGYDPQTIKSLLGVRTVISGRSIKVQQKGELYIMMFPSTQGHRFFQDMRLDPHFVGIPDTERLLLLYIYQYVTHPQYIIDETNDGNGVNGGVDEDINGQNGHIVPNPITVSEVPNDPVNGPITS